MSNEIKKKIEDKKLRLDFLQAEVTEMSREATNIKVEMAKLKSQLNRSNQKKNKLSITDHCLVRYIERHMGIDINLIKTTMIDVFSGESNNGNIDGKYTINEITVVIKDNTIITIY